MSYRSKSVISNLNTDLQLPAFIYPHFSGPIYEGFQNFDILWRGTACVDVVGLHRICKNLIFQNRNKSN